MTTRSDEDEAIDELRAMLAEPWSAVHRQTTERLDVARRAAGRFPGSPVVLALAAVIAAKQAPHPVPQVGREWIDRALQISPDDDQVRFLAAVFEQEAGNSPRAIELLELNIAAGGEAADYGELASAMSSCGRHEDAIRLLETSPLAGEPRLQKQIADLREELKSIELDRSFEAMDRERERGPGSD